MHITPLIRDLAVILGIAGFVTVAFRKIRQPVVLGYLVAGIIVGPHLLPIPLVTDIPNIKALAELGVIFLMFSIGLEFSFHKLLRIGPSAAGIAVIEVAVMNALGFVLGQTLGWSNTDSIFLGAMVSISSTTIIVKAFEELKLKTHRFAEVVFGVLIVEDLAAIILLASLPTIAASGSGWGIQLLYSGLKLSLVVGTWFIVGYFVIPSLLRYAGKWMDDETLTVGSVGLCLCLVAVAGYFGYSAALGAFIMGSILSETDQGHRIEGLIHPLKSLFAAVFFVSVGMLMDPRVLLDYWGVVAAIISLVVLGKFVFPFFGALLYGHPVNRAVRIGLSLTQIGEFSFIIATMGDQMGIIGPQLYPIAVSVSIITSFLTPYFIQFSPGFAETLSKVCPKGLLETLARYHRWSSEPMSLVGAGEVLLPKVIKLVVNGMIVTAIFVVDRFWLVQWVYSRTGSLALTQVFSFSTALFLSAPFIWGMLSAFGFANRRDAHVLQVPMRFQIFLGRAITVLWLGVLTSAFFATWVGFLVTVLISLLLLMLFYKRLGISYQWFEKQLMSNIRKEGSSSHESLKQSLAPWDLHLVQIFMHPNAKLSGVSLNEAKIRASYGLNIVLIRRGDLTISPPGPNDSLLPGDEILVLGLDDQIDRFRADTEVSQAPASSLTDVSRYLLKRVLVTAKADFFGKTIRDSGIREKSKSLVVGLERAGTRTLNPDASTVIADGDILWMVTET